jgi:O-antigen/teichoic acid export membrane protein
MIKTFSNKEKNLTYIKNMYKFGIKKIKKLWHDPLYRNSYYLMLNSIVISILGFFFWVLAARFYSVNDIGISTSLISSASFIILLSKLGFDFSIVRFFPIRNKSEIFNTSIFISMTVALILGAIFIIGIDFFSPNLSLLKTPQNSLMFLIYVWVSSITTLTGMSFIAMRKPEYYFLQNLIISLKILFIFFFVFYGAIGIFLTFELSILLSLIVALFLLKSELTISLSIKKKFIKESLRFSFGNYFTSIFYSLPNLIIPIIVLNLLGSKAAAYYYISFTIALIIFVIPDAVSTSLLVEGSHGENLKKNTSKSFTIIFALLIPAITIIYFFGESILILFGKNYVESLNLLKLFTFSGFFVAINSIYFSIKRVQMEIKKIVFLATFNCILLFILTYVFLLKFGIIGVGYAWISTYGIAVLIIGLSTIKKKK